jgi:hypothetical protein
MKVVFKVLLLYDVRKNKSNSPTVWEYFTLGANIRRDATLKTCPQSEMLRTVWGLTWQHRPTNVS